MLVYVSFACICKCVGFCVWGGGGGVGGSMLNRTDGSSRPNYLGTHDYNDVVVMVVVLTFDGDRMTVTIYPHTTVYIFVLQMFCCRSVLWGYAGVTSSTGRLARAADSRSDSRW